MTYKTYKNLVHDLARHEASIAQKLERPTGISGKSWVRLPLGNSENVFSE